MESYLIRIYRERHRHPQNIVGIVEAVGGSEKKAFTNLDELYEILTSIKNKPGQPKQNTIFLSNRYEPEKRSELRKAKKIACSLVCKRKNVKAETVNCSKNGVALRVADKLPLPVGDVLKFKIKDATLKAQVKWVAYKPDPAMTFAGLNIIKGKLDMRGMRERQAGARV